MSEIYKLENKKLEERYGPAIAQFICDELEKSERMSDDKKNQTKKPTEGYAKETIMYKAA